MFDATSAPQAQATPARIVVQPAAAADCGALAALEEICFATDRVSATEFLDLAAEEDCRILVARLEGALVGHAVGRRRADTLYVYTLAVDPALRRRGVARSLLEGLAAVARAWGCSRIELEVREDNLEAMNLYRSAGFSIGEAVHDWYEDGAGARCAAIDVDGFGRSHARGRGPTRPVLLIVTGGTPELQPSRPESLATFATAAEAAGLDPRFWNIEGGEPPRAEAGFIRTHTEIGGKAEWVARTFEEWGAPVLDRTSSISRGCNKVHQALVFAAAGVTTPKTHFVFELAHVDCAIASIGDWPIVVKDPVGSFCRGIFLAHNRAELERFVAELLTAGNGAVLQAFEPTDFDWRIGVLGRRPLFAARYGMAAGSWKICNRDGQLEDWGHSDAVALAETPADVLDLALRACTVLGDGLWGVDLKVKDGRPMVIEVNDNPNIDDRLEASALGDRVWERTALWFAEAVARTRFEARRA